jgi:S-adenosylmethionine decarboxylase
MDLQSETALCAEDVFEGPEKKLEVYFTRSGPTDGLRHYGSDAWGEMLAAASCTIVSKRSNVHFDAYLLSESSLFVFPYRVVLKTCGTTTLLLVVHQLLRMGMDIGAELELLQYGHLRYKFPEQQVYPHASFDQEHAYLVKMFGEVSHCSLGPPDCHWVMLSVERRRTSPRSLISPPASPKAGDDILEIAMEGLAQRVCALFSKSCTAGATMGGDGSSPEDRALAIQITRESGLKALLPGVDVDDWAFDPCGYSMNGLRAGFYYTVHVTPEEAFSYASFETNDPAYRDPAYVAAIVRAFAPKLAVVSLTTRSISCELPAYALDGFERAGIDFHRLGSASSVCCASFTAASVEISALAISTIFPKCAALEKCSKLAPVS